MKAASRIKILLIVFILTGLGALFVLLKGSNGNTYEKDAEGIAIKNVEAIEKVTFEKNNIIQTVQKNDKGEWEINKKYKTSEQLIQLMLLGLNKMEVRRPVSSENKNKVIQFLKTQAYKVKVYYGSNTSSFFIATNENDPNSSYYMEEKSAEPSVIYVPGFTGDISNLFKLKEEDWRSKAIFSSSIRSIQNIKVTYLDKPGASFEIFYKDNFFHVRDLDHADTTRLINYLQLYEHANAMNFVTAKKDSLEKIIDLSHPFATIELREINEEKNNVLDIFIDPTNSKNMYGIVKKENELVSLSDKFYRQLLVTKNHFDSKRHSLSEQ